MGNSKFNVLDASALFFFFFDLSIQNMVRVFEGKLCRPIVEELRNGKRAACNHGVMDARGRLLSTKEA